MRFMLSLIFDESLMDEITPERMAEIAAEMNAYNDGLREAGVYEAGEGLGPTRMARTLRWGERGQPVATDGPFAESREQLGGFWILGCEDLEAAAGWAAGAPVENGAIEIRQIVESGQEALELHARRG